MVKNGFVINRKYAEDFRKRLEKENREENNPRDVWWVVGVIAFFVILIIL